MEPGNELLEVYENIKSILKTGDVEVSDYQLIEYGLQFTVSILDWSGIIRIYQNKKGALNLLHKHLEKGDSPFYLLSMVAFQFRQLLIAKQKIIDNQSFKNLRWRPFVIEKTKALSEKFSFEQLKKVYEQISRIGLDTKTGKISPELGLDLFVAYLQF